MGILKRLQYLGKVLVELLFSTLCFLPWLAVPFFFLFFFQISILQGIFFNYVLISGLFSRAISQSGSALCPWALNEDNPYDAAFKLGRAFGLETKDPKVLVDFLRKISACVLTKKQSVAVSETVS